MNEICNDVEITEKLLLYGSDSLTLDENSKIFTLVENYIMKSDRFVI